VAKYIKVSLNSRASYLGPAISLCEMQIDKGEGVWWLVFKRGWWWRAEKLGTHSKQMVFSLNFYMLYSHG